MRKWMWVAIVLVAVACSKDKDKDKGASSKGDDKQAAPADAAPKSPADLFVGKTVTMPEHVAKIKYGMTEADAKAAHPEVFEAKYGYVPPGYKDGYNEIVETTVQIEDGRVYQTRTEIKHPIEKVKEWVTAKWGPPTWETKNSIGNPEIYWDAPDVGLRMMLEKSASNSMLRFDPVMSAEAALGSDPKLWGWEKTPLIGSSREDVMKAYDIYRPRAREEDPDSISFSTFDIAGMDSYVTVSVRVKNDKVTGYTLGIPSKLNDKLVPRLEQMFGPGKLDSMKMYTDFKGPPPAKAEIRDKDGFSTTVWVGDYKK